MCFVNCWVLRHFSQQYYYQAYTIPNNTPTWIMTFSVLLEMWCLSFSTEAPRQCFQFFFPPSSFTLFPEWLGNWIHYEFSWHQYKYQVYVLWNDKWWDVIAGACRGWQHKWRSEPHLPWQWHQQPLQGTKAAVYTEHTTKPPPASALSLPRRETRGMSDPHLTLALWELGHLDNPFLRFW